MIPREILPLLSLATGYSLIQGYVDPNCPDINLNEVCHEQCVNTALGCIQTCDSSDSQCISVCLREEGECYEGCPCNIDCQSGCSECDHPVCQCADKKENDQWNKCIDANGAILGRCFDDCADDESCEAICTAEFKQNQKRCPCETDCPGGCPCDEFECDDSPIVTTTPSTTTTPIEQTEKAVLLLDNKKSANKPMVISFDGEVDDDLEFQFIGDAIVRGGCPATLNGRFFYFGGSNNHSTKVSKIENCSMEIIGDMGFNFNYGACNTFVSENEEFVLLCFSRSSKSSCHRYDGENFYSSRSTTYTHEDVTSLGNYRDQPFTTGGYRNTDTEILTISTDTWLSAASYPFSSSISYYSTASIAGKVYIIGGINTLDKIAEYSDDQWTDYGSLSTGRYAHSSITHDSQTMIIGAYGSSSVSTIPTEVWNFTTGDNKDIDPVLVKSNYDVGSALYLVDLDYCRKNK